MASKRRIRRRSCECKKPYTKEQAGARAYELRKRGVIVYTYLCKFSGHWHIGHRPAKIHSAIEQVMAHKHNYK